MKKRQEDSWGRSGVSCIPLNVVLHRRSLAVIRRFLVANRCSLAVNHRFLVVQNPHRFWIERFFAAGRTPAAQKDTPTDFRKACRKARML